MPKKTLALISGLVLITVVLFVVALRSSEQKSQTDVTPSPVANQPTPTSAANSVLSLSPNPVTVASGGTGTVEVLIDTSDNDVTAVQLELSYDPDVVGNVRIVPGPLFANPAVLINKNDQQAGQYTYAFGITPNSSTIQGTGNVATITFTARGAAGQQSQLTLLPTTLVTARGVASSVLKVSSGTNVIIGQGGSAPVQSSSPSAGL